jgi:uncharacterized protein
MIALRWLVALLMLIGLAGVADGAVVSIPRSPTQWATDTSGFLKPQTVANLDARLRAYESTTGHQVLLYVTPTTGDTPTEDWTVGAFQRWKVGRKGLDDGLILFVFPADRKVRIEVGYGLEQTVPDATAARIIRDMTPKLKAGQPDEAVTVGVAEILATIGGETRAAGGEALGKAGDALGTSDQSPPRRSTPASVDPYDTSRSNGIEEILGESLGILIGLVIVVGIIVLIMKLPNPKGTYISSRSSGFGWGGLLFDGVVGGLTGGGFSGGGGMSGGGGATGSW